MPVPSLHRESTDTLIVKHVDTNFLHVSCKRCREDHALYIA